MNLILLTWDAAVFHQKWFIYDIYHAKTAGKGTTKRCIYRSKWRSFIRIILCMPQVALYKSSGFSLYGNKSQAYPGISTSILFEELFRLVFH